MKFIDVCAGVGGFRMAMESHGHECVYTIEYNKDAIKSLKSTWKFDKNEAWFGDMYEMDYNTIPDFDVLCGGFPCAKFSVIGDRKGFESEDPRANVFFELMKIAELKKPKYLFFENVKGLLSHDGGKSFETIINKMAELGYNVEWQLVNPKDFGYPVLRERVYIIGHLRDECSEPILPITKAYRQDDRSSPSIYQFTRGNFRRLVGYAPTLLANMGTGGNNVPYVVDKVKNSMRILTPRECFRLQGFEDHYIDKIISSGISNSALYERAGRTIFLPLVKDIAKGFK